MTATLGLLPSAEDFCAIGDRPLYCGFRAVFSLSGSGLARDRFLEKGLPLDSKGSLTLTVSGGFGRFPNDAWLVTSTGSPASARFGLQRWADARWQVVRTTITGASVPDALAIVSLGHGGAGLVRDEYPPLLEGLGTLQASLARIARGSGPLSDSTTDR